MEAHAAQEEEPKQTGGDAETEEGNKFQKAIGAWRSMSMWRNNQNRMLMHLTDIDLTALIPQLDTVASDLVAHQRDTLTQRKELAQKTKDFRKLDDESKLSDIKGLLKCRPLLVQDQRHSKLTKYSIPKLH